MLKDWLAEATRAANGGRKESEEAAAGYSGAGSNFLACFVLCSFPFRIHLLISCGPTQVNVAEGKKQRVILESEGNLEAKSNEANATYKMVVREAEARHVLLSIFLFHAYVD
jgi:hypothetical protein